MNGATGERRNRFACDGNPYVMGIRVRCPIDFCAWFRCPMRVSGSFRPRGVTVSFTHAFPFEGARLVQSG